MYAHTDTTLFTLNPASALLAVTQVGAFDCIGGTGEDTAMLDLAVDSRGNLWGTSAKNVYSLVIQGASRTARPRRRSASEPGLRFTGSPLPR